MLERGGKRGLRTARGVASELQNGGARNRVMHEFGRIHGERQRYGMRNGNLPSVANEKLSFVGRLGLGEVIALHHMRPKFTELLQLLRCLNTFGDDL